MTIKTFNDCLIEFRKVRKELDIFKSSGSKLAGDVVTLQKDVDEIEDQLDNLPTGDGGEDDGDGGGGAVDSVFGRTGTVIAEIGDYPPDKLGTGTTDATTFLRGDGTWQTISTPAAATPEDEIPVGTMNGTNKNFTISFTPTIKTLHLSLNGVRQNPLTDFSIVGVAITYTVAPKSTDWHRAQYTH